MSNTTKPVIVRSGKAVTLFLDGQMHNVGGDHPNYQLVIQAIEREDWDALPKLVNVAKAVETYVNNGKDGSGFTVVGGLIHLDGRPFSPSVSKKALAMMEQALDPTPIHNFLRRTRKNPSRIAQEELLLFCAANSFMIDDEGFIIAFKGVRSDFKDQYSGTFDNSPGRVVEVERNAVDDRRHVTCSYGLHFGAREYADNFARRTVVVKVDPADVVSIPEDYGNQKGRCCRYEVIAEINKGTPLPQKEVYSRQDFPVLPEPGVDDFVAQAGGEVDTPAVSAQAAADAPPVVADPGYVAPGTNLGLVADEEEEEEDEYEYEEEEDEEEEDEEEDLTPALQQSLQQKYESMSRDELRELCKKRGAKGRGKVKQDYIDALMQQVANPDYADAVNEELLDG